MRNESFWDILSDILWLGIAVIGLVTVIVFLG